LFWNHHTFRRGDQPSISTTDIADSMYSHLIAYAADEAMREHRFVELARVWFL